MVKSHGSATDYGVANAIGVAAKLVAENITSRITDDLANVKDASGMTLRARIVGTGSALPKTRVSNEDLAQRVDTSDEWIVARTGIRFRHIAQDGETTSTLATDACQKALKAANVEAGEVDLIILATATPDQTFPASATKVQAALGIDDCIAFDVAAVCSAFYKAPRPLRTA